MASLEKITTDVASAKVYSIQQMAIELVILKAGGKPQQMKNLTALKRLIRMLNFQINAGVNDADTTFLYNCLLKSLNGFSAGYTIDPSVKSGATINVISGVLTLNKTEADLIDAGGGNWYLPYLDNFNNPIAAGIVPVSTITTGVSFAFTFDSTFSPPRIYGFANKAPQVILVTAV